MRLFNFPDGTVDKEEASSWLWPIFDLDVDDPVEEITIQNASLLRRQQEDSDTFRRP